jgi:YD repeat-containing protein
MRCVVPSTAAPPSMATRKSCSFDFEGHALLEQRQLVADHKTQPDWSVLLGHATVDAMALAAAPLLDTETFSASSSRDALGRVLTAISPDNSTVTYTYDEGGALQRVTLEHRGSQTTQTIVGEVTYNARGQRETVIYGSADSPTTTTTYAYDPQTYRVTRLSTIRGFDGAALQGLHYHYDPAGNITDIRDTAQQTVYFQNAVVEAANSYTYDAIYRLIEATEGHAGGAAKNTVRHAPALARSMNQPPFSYGYTGGALGATDMLGNIIIKRGLTGPSLAITLRHEGVHRFFSPKTPGPFQMARARVGQWGYNTSHLLRYTEEALAEGIATRSLRKGLAFPMHGYSIEYPRLILETTLYGGTIIGGRTIVKKATEE